jgi:SWI/SNF-related matrix-associated actin-dependent regulator 1 of chromatin subfamily A
MTPPTLYVFQREDVDKIMEEFIGRALLALQVGLGKSIEALYCLKHLPGARPGIIVCPASLKLNWQREALRFGFKAKVLEGRRPRIDWFQVPKLLIINYEILECWVPVLRNLKPRMVIIDEAQRIKDLHSKTSILTTQLAAKVPYCLLLTGTPIVNRHWDLYPILHILDPEEFDSPFDFGMSFCSADNSGGKLVFKDSVNRKELHEILCESYLIRRLKEDVLPDLPPLTKTIIPLDIKRKEYEHAERDLIGWLATVDLAAADRAKRAAAFVKFNYLKRIAVKHKMPLVFEWIDNWLDESEVDAKLIIGAWHRKTWPHTIEALEKRYGKALVSVHGGIKDKDAVVQEFQNNPKVRIAALQLRSGGVGLNLQGKDRTMLLVEYPWTKADVEQFMGRAHRIGTQNPVNVYFLIAAGTIEEHIVSIIDSKDRIENTTIDGGRSRYRLNLLDELVKIYSQQGRKVRKK